MHRVQWFEIHDSPWCPAGWREGLVDFLSFFARAFRPYDAIAGRLGEAVGAAGARRVVDLCTGAGAPALAVQRALRERGQPLTFVLTDKFPHPGLSRDLPPGGPGECQVLAEPVDATAVPPTLEGFRTLFTAFHHFPPRLARSILEDAVRNGQGIGVFEYTDRNFLVWGPALLMTPFLLWAVTPFLRPVTVGRLVWTYLLPVIPLIAVWDGFVSCLRTYSPAELEALTASLRGRGYRWEIGRATAFWGCRVTYCVGRLESTA